MNTLNRCSRQALIGVCLWLTNSAFAAATDPEVDPASANHELRQLWAPVADEVYLQEVGEQVATDKPVTAVALSGNVAYAVVGGALKILRSGVLVDAEGAPSGVKRLRSLAGALWAVAEKGTYRYTGTTWERVDERPFVDLCLHLGRVYGATRDDLFRFADGKFVNIRPAAGYLSTDTTQMREDFSQVLADPVAIGPVERIASYSGTLYLLRPGNLALIEGKTFVSDIADWGALPSPVTRDLLALGSRLYVATDSGVGVVRGMALTSLRGPDGLPYEDTTCLAAGFDGDVWIGTPQGAIRKTENEYHYFGARHWLPGDYVRDIAVGDHVAYIATDGGLGIIRYEPYTLLKKANCFQQQMGEWGFKRLGFVHKLYRQGDNGPWLREISDNDGGNTAHYLAAMSFRYAATGEEGARQEAMEAFKAMVWLEEITAKPGFIARAIWSVKGDQGQRSTRGSGGLPAKWYPTPDGVWSWKGDTSSDEVNAHFYAVSAFHDLAASGLAKERAAQHLARIATHIIDNGWVLRDMDGKPTRWGRWDPDYLLRPYGFDSRGLNGMEAQTYMHTAYAMTGDARFQQGLEQLIKWRYPAYTVRQRLTFPPDQIAPWDDELAFFCYHPLLSYAKDPDLRSIYLRSLERSWEILRMQRDPFYNFIYGSATGNDCEAAQAAQYLREWPLDLGNYSYHNSHRSDLMPQRGYVPYSGGTRFISPRELEATWGARSPAQYDGGEGGQGVTPPNCWLEDYWMGRYYGFIKPPRTQDAELITVPPRALARKGAAPYDGPPRPVGVWEK